MSLPIKDAMCFAENFNFLCFQMRVNFSRKSCVEVALEIDVLPLLIAARTFHYT